MGRPVQPAANRLREYTSVSTAVKFSPPIGWLHVISTGNVTLKDENGDAVTITGCVGGEVYEGPFAELTSMTATKIRMGDGAIPVAALATVATSAATSLDTANSTQTSADTSLDTARSVLTSVDTSLMTRFSTSVSTLTSQATSLTTRISIAESVEASKG